jgi:hypothetical protein
MRKITPLTALAFVVVLFVTGYAEATEFKGITLGETLRKFDESSVFGSLDCNPMRMDPGDYHQYVQEMQPIVVGVRQVCMASTSIATVPADVTVLLGSARRVLRMTFEFAGEDHEQVLAAMVEKWGEGVEEIYDNADEVVWWVFGDGSSISVHKLRANVSNAASGDAAIAGLVEFALPETTPAGDL